MKHRTLLLVTLVFQFIAHAQELTVKSMITAPMDLSASHYERKDLAGKPCALVKVQLAVYGAQFEGNVISPVEYKTGEYWVYMSQGSYMLSVKHPSYLPLELDFRDFGINGVKGKRTYKLTLLQPQSGSASADDGMNYLVMTVEPTNASVSIDGQAQMVQDGTLSILLPMGEHRYEVSAPAFETKSGTFTLGGEKLTLPVRLSSAMATLTVSCATSGTQIYVNDELKGTTSWSGSLPAGSYRVEGRLAGYRSHRQNVTLAKLGSQQVTIPALQSVSGNLNVNYQPTNAEVWIDGRKAGSSPDIFRNLKVGSHVVELRASGYQSKKETVTIQDGQTAMLTGSLEPQTVAQAQSIIQSPKDQGQDIPTSTGLGVGMYNEQYDIPTSAVSRSQNSITPPTPLNKSFRFLYKGVTFRCRAKKGYITITGFDTGADNVTIPGKAEFGGEYYPVRAVDTFINGNNYVATTLVIEEGVEHIDNYAFVEFRKLVDVTIPSTIKEIGKNAFRDNVGMRFNVPSGINEHDLRNGHKIRVQ